MSDFDFDELDKAVSGVLGTTSEGSHTTTSPSQAVTSSPTVSSLTSTSITPSKAAPNTDVKMPTSTAETAPSTTPALRRSAGRFMDVVHPSSDMRTRNGSETTLAPLSRPPVKAETEANDTVDRKGEDNPGWSQPLESPFLPDAKVEKRPLGGDPLMSTVFEVENTLAEPQSLQDNSLKLEAPDEPRIEAHTMPDPIEFALQADPIEIKPEQTASDPAPEKNDDLLEADFTAEKPTTQSFDTFTLDQALQDESPSTKAAQPADEPVGPLSITQQYTEQPRTEQTSGAIYDTEAYHQPVAHPAKKKTGIGVILWIVLLLAVGAGAGVAFYFYVLPML